MRGRRSKDLLLLCEVGAYIEEKKYGTRYFGCGCSGNNHTDWSNRKCMDYEAAYTDDYLYPYTDTDDYPYYYSERTKQVVNYWDN
jgi:hypothetical protein